MEEVERYRPFDRYIVLPWDTVSQPVPWPLSSPNPSSAETRRRSSRGCAWRRAGVKWVETMSFVAQAAKGGHREKVLDRLEKKRPRIEERKKVLSRQHSRATKDPDRRLCGRNHK